MFDVAVVGGGVMGASIAYHSARKGASVLIIDEGLPGRATTAGAGIISTVGLDPQESDPLWLGLVDDATAAYRTLFTELGQSAAHASEYATVGELIVARNAVEEDRIRELESRIVSHAAPIHLKNGGPRRVTGADLGALWPHVDRSLNALYIPGTARVDGNKLAALLLSQAEKAGAHSVRGRARYSASPSGGCVTVGGDPVSTASIVIANGAWAQPLLHSAGVNVEVVADRGQIVHLNTGRHSAVQLPVLKTFDGPYILGFEGGRIVAGATHEVVKDYDSSIRAGDQFEVLHDALSVAPGLAAASIIETRVGLRPASSDGLPIIGPTDVPGTFAAAGLGSWGLTLAPLLGDVVSDLVLQRPCPYDVDFLSPHRAPEWRTPLEVNINRGEIA